MNGLKTAALTVVLIAAIMCGCLLLVGLNAERTVLSDEYYRGLLDEVDLAHHIHDIAYANLRAQMMEELPEPAADIMAGSLAHAFDPEWLGREIVLVIDDILAYVRGEQEGPTAVIDLSENIETLTNEFVSAVEELSVDERVQIGLPPGTNEGELRGFIGEMELPERLELAELVGDLPPEEVVRTIQRYRGYLRSVPYIALAVLMVLFCLLSDLPRALRWFGASAIASGVLIMSVLLFARHHLLPRVIADAGEAGEPGFAPEIFRAVADYTAARMYLSPVVYGAFGVVLVASGLILARRSSITSPTAG